LLSNWGGTGVFTERIKKMARSNAKKIILKKDPHLRERLIHRFPNLSLPKTHVN